MKAPRSKRLALLIMAGVLLVSMAHPALALLDQDGDGLFDGWEWQFGFSLSGSYPGGAGGADLDGDGMTNLKESLAGTNPRDPGSRLALRAEANIAAHELRLHFPTMTGRLYQVEKCTNLSQPTWEPVGDEVNGNDADAVVVTTLPQQEGAAVFFRLKARPDQMDFDGDGLPDWWENAHGLEPTDPDDALADDDWDGFRNFEEAVAGTDRSDPDSIPLRGIEGYDSTDGQPIQINLTSEGGNGEEPVYNVTSPLAKGTLSGSAPALTYTPTTLGPWEQDYFEFTVSQGGYTSAPAWITINSTIPPVAPTVTVTAGGVALPGSSDELRLFGQQEWIAVTLRFDPGDYESGSLYLWLPDTGTVQAWAPDNTELYPWDEDLSIDISHPGGRLKDLALEESGRTVTFWVQPLEGAGASDIFLYCFYDGSQTSDRLLLQPVEIVPDEGMAGVIGDVVKSAKSGSTVKHFVTPKKSTELNQEFVELKAEGIDAALFDQMFVWEGGEAGSAANKRKVKRDATGTGPTEVKIKSKQDNAVLAQMDVWVVWATCTATKGTGIFNKNFGASQYLILLNSRWRFVFKIEPATIIIAPDGERPDLEGLASNPVPGAGKKFGPDPSVGDGDSARFKWDVSRQFKETIENHQLIPKEALRWDPPFLAGQPVADTTLFGWPAGDSAEGNDDPLKFDEDDNPYEANTDPLAAHAIGELSSFDSPFLLPFYESCGGQGRTLVDDVDFREFCRLEIWNGVRTAGRFWYRISDFETWHVGCRGKWNAITSSWDDDSSRPSETDSGNLYP